MPHLDGNPPRDESAHVWSLNGRTWAVLRRSDGVPTLEGPTDTPSLGLLCWLVGMSALVLGIPLFAWRMGADWFVLLYTGGVTGTLALLLLVTAVRVICVRRKLSGLRSAAAIAESLAVEPDTIQRLASAHSIRPGFIVNGVPLYDPESLTSRMDLLCPSSAPPDSALLRVPANVDHPADTLLRPDREARDV